MDKTNAEAGNVPLWRYGAYVGRDFRIVIHLHSPGCLEVKRLAESSVNGEGKADVTALLGSPVQDRNPSAWDVRSNDIDESSGALSTFVNSIPLQEFTAFMEKNPAIRGTLSYENCEQRGFLKFESRRRKPLREHQDIRWWSERTGYKEVPYEEFVRIEGEAPEEWEPGC